MCVDLTVPLKLQFPWLLMVEPCHVFHCPGKKNRIESTFLLSPKAPLTISHLSQARSALAENPF